MRRDFSKKQYHRQRRGSRSGTVVLYIAVAILLSGIGLIAYGYKKHPENFPVAAANFSRLANWLSRDKHAVQDTEKTNRLAENEEVSDRQIHFEFYSALPNMRMEVSKPVDEKTLVATKAERPVVETVNPKTAQASFISPAELERDFSNELTKQQPYVVQLGVFGNLEAANGYKQSLHRAGFNVDVVKVPMNGKIAYRVQFGPYGNKDQARVVQKQLQKKNVSALIRTAVALQ